VTSQLVLLYGAAFLGHAVFLASCVSVAAMLGVRVLEVRLGTPQMLRLGLWSVGAIPIVGNARFAFSHENPGAVPAAGDFDQQSRLARVAISLSGCAGLLLAAFLLRGTDAWHSFVNTFGQIVAGVTAPPTRGADLIAGYFRLADEAGIRVALGSILAKLAAFNLLPIPFLSGGMALQELMRPAGQAPPPSPRATWLQYLGVTLLLANLGVWAWAMVVVLTR